MNAKTEADLITTEVQLQALFGEVSAAAMRKEVTHITPEYSAMIAASPFAVLATSGAQGLDASPRGDQPGFVVVDDPHTLLLPERRGNNRVDSLRNILADPRVALLFLIPGVGEMLRVMGRAAISVEPALLARFEVDGKQPKCVIRIAVESAFFQCGRAALRSKLWLAKSQQRETPLPTAGQMLSAIMGQEIDGAQYDRDLPARQRGTLY